MFQEERRQAIVELLDAHGRVSVRELTASFGVTEDCIRKDLKALSLTGVCKRVYGGATKAESKVELAVTDRIGVYASEKRVIARKAVKLIEPEMSVFLDISTTNLEIARCIAQAEIRCNVVSTMIGVLTILAASPSVTALCPGGVLRPSLDGFVGGQCVKAMSNYRFDLSFMGCYGVDAASADVTTHALEDGIVKEAAVARTRRNYIVAESRKLHSYGSYCYGRFEDFEALICDGGDVEGIAQVRRAGLVVL
ncbi:DeoR/GlpR family DNA-binding transcription regulator [Paratractidigestivibacter sp.]|uniref:DeoR/GlpR family DNA-binding transcription regulator n=1 Tax=Paratractidigestivibacter sp. TaxID=2847316 RepID=UPI002ABD1C23|nr:DeoR/GlpR family DNA-binding transcription regulator [Paratractidigestivibacter sp.]